MRECTNPAVKDQLPDLLDDRGAAALAAVRAHVAECESCSQELSLLRDVRSLAVTPSLDVARIAAAVPAYRAAPSGHPWRRMWHSPVLRAAAVLLVVTGGALLLVRPPEGAPRDTAVVHVAQETTRVPVSGDVPAARPAAAELAVGHPLSDLSESDLRDLLDELPAIEAVTSTETDVIVLPAVGRSGE